MDGKLAYVGAPGPGGVHPEELPAVLDWLLARSAPTRLRIVPGPEPGVVRLVHPSRPAEPYSLALPATLTSESRSLLGDGQRAEWKEVIPGRLLRYEQPLGAQYALTGEARADEGGVNLTLSLQNLTDRPLAALRAEAQLTQPGVSEPSRATLDFADCAPGETTTATAGLSLAEDGALTGWGQVVGAKQE